ncbi:hypothetical protein AQ915_09135 [Burkholderia pseudomallei]|nr:hypothetical protein AQ915_09135 [Burkholderia pseudomallei]
MTHAVRTRAPAHARTRALGRAPPAAPAARRTPRAERRAPNAARRTPRAERRTPNGRRAPTPRA